MTADTELVLKRARISRGPYPEAASSRLQRRQGDPPRTLRRWPIARFRVEQNRFDPKAWHPDRIENQNLLRLARSNFQRQVAMISMEHFQRVTDGPQVIGAPCASPEPTFESLAISTRAFPAELLILVRSEEPAKRRYRPRSRVALGIGTRIT